jgi:hypothetical protein
MAYRLLNEEVQRLQLTQEGIKPTVLVGLGGTGGDVLLKVRKKIFERYGSPTEFPVVQFVYVDTDTTNQHIDSHLLEEFKFTPQERVDAVVLDTAKYTRNLNQHPLIKAWWYPTLHDLAQVKEGAGQIRGYSRLAFFANFDTIKNAIENALNMAMASSTAMWEKHKVQVDTSKGAYIYIVASVAGGTGSGMFIDTGYLCKTLAAGVTTVGFLVFPGIFQLHQERIFGNSFAALKELEHFTFPENKFNYEWTQGYPPRSKRPLPPPVFNYCYLVDSGNWTGNTINFASRYSIFEMVANNIFQDFGSSDFAAHKRGVRVNLDSFLTNFYVSEILDPRDSSKSLLTEAFTTRHSAFGMTSIRYPADRIRHACAAKLGEDIMTRLSQGKLPEMQMTRWIFEQFFAPPERAKVKLFIGRAVVEGKPIHRNDILDALNETETPGKQVEALAREWCMGLQSNVKMGAHKTRNLPLSQFLQAEINQVLINFRDETYDPDWQKWGGYVRRMRSNKQNYLKREILGDVTPEGRRIPARLELAIADIVNDANKGIQFAKMLLTEMRLILTEDAYLYQPVFRKEAAELGRLVIEKQKSYQRTLDEIRHRENESGLTKLLFYHATMEHLTETLFAELQEYLIMALKLRSRQEAIDICDTILTRIGQEGHVIDDRTKARTDDTGLMRELIELEKTVSMLKQEFTTRKNDFSKPQEDELTLFLYEPKDIDERYYRRYLGADDATRTTKISEQAVEILTQLPSPHEAGQVGIKVMDLSPLTEHYGVNGVVKMILKETTKPFATVGDDFAIMELFFDRYKTTPEQIGQLQLLYNKSQIWLQSTTDSNFKLGHERRICLVGIYEDPHRSKFYDTFKDLIKNKIRTPEQPAVSFFPLQSKSEVIFYTEAAGFPLCFSRSVHDMRPKYEKLALDNFVNLHADRNEFQFRDILELTEGERKALENATRTFLLGLLLDIVRVVHDADNDDDIFYVEQRIGLSHDKRFLGTEHRAIRVLLRDSNLREQLDRFIRQRESELMKDPDDWARYYATLSHYQDKLYPPIRTQSLARETREQATTENLVLREKLKNIEKTYDGDVEAFRERALALSKNLTDVARPLTGAFYAVNHTWSKTASVDL